MSMSHPLRIAIALPGIHRVARGAETAMEQIARQLAESGLDVTVFGSGPPRNDQPYHYQQISAIARENFERFPRIPPLRSHYAWEELTFAAGLLRRFRAKDFDLTIGCSYPFVNWVLRSGSAKHIYITQNGDWPLRHRKLENRYFGCDGLVCTNPQFFARHGEKFCATLIPNGVDDAVFHPGESANKTPVVLMVSALIPSKRVVDGIRAVANAGDFSLVIAGDGECRNEVDELGQTLLGERYRRVILPREQMPELYRSADIFLHMSQDEPSANAYMEALASGLPIVTHDWEVTRWTLENCGLFVDTSDLSSVTAALGRAVNLRKRPDIQRRRDLVAKRFTWKSIGRQYVEFLHKVIEPASNEITDEKPLDDVGVVIIGRNEGDRLIGCLKSLAGKTAAMVYVDSGSSDGSVAAAKDLGATVVELDRNVPFTAARARNTGFRRLLELAPNISFVQFVDGDCEVRDGWLTLAERQPSGDSQLAVVCGRRRERFPDASIYNRLADIEWNTPIGPAKSCGGDAMIRVAAFKQVGGYNDDIIAGEEPEMCVRLRQAGWKIERVNAEMTLHDASMKYFGQWWRRSVRAGHAYAEGFARHGAPPERFNANQVRSIVFWGMFLPVIFVISTAAVFWKSALVILPLLILAAYLAMIVRIQHRKIDAGLGFASAWLYGFFVMLGKFPQMIGLLQYFLLRRMGRRSKLIEYKSAAAPQEVA